MKKNKIYTVKEYRDEMCQEAFERGKAKMRKEILDIFKGTKRIELDYEDFCEIIENRQLSQPKEKTQ